MPEGPSIVILKETTQSFKGLRVLSAAGNTKAFEPELLKGRVLTDIRSWGKHFLLCFEELTVRVHFMLFGSYRINESKTMAPRLHLRFSNQQELNFYACSVKLLTASPDELYDWTADIMNPNFNSKKALFRLKQQPETLACDALLDQHIFSGSGNIIKNEVLFRIKIHPLSLLGKIPEVKLRELVAETVNYSFDFLRWKKEFTLRKHWLAHTKTICPRDQVPFIRAHLGKTNRRSFFCAVCQRLHV